MIKMCATPHPAHTPPSHLPFTLSVHASCCTRRCDLGHSFKPWAQHERWSGWVTEEFFLLGDRERDSSVLVSPLCDRSKDTNLPKNQLGFFEFLCFPFYKASRPSMIDASLRHRLLTPCRSPRRSRA